MAEIPGILRPHRITVETYRGEGSEGPSYAPPVAELPVRQEGRIDVTADGQHVGSAKVYARTGDGRLLTVGSKVTLHGGGVGVVSARAEHLDGGLGAWQHVEATITGGGR